MSIYHKTVSPASTVQAAYAALKPTAVLAETFARVGSTLANASALTSGRMHLCALYIPTNTLVTSISFISGGTAAGTPTNQWFALYGSDRSLLRQTTNDTTTAWAANTIKTLNLTSTFTTTYSGLYYLGLMVTATTVPTLTAVGSASGAEKAYGLTPIVNGTSDTGLTTTAPASAGISANTSSYPYAYVS